MKTRANAVTLFCALALAAVVDTASRAATLAPPRAGFSFPQKQTLTYAVDWRVFPAGTAVIHFERPATASASPPSPTPAAPSICFFTWPTISSPTSTAQKGCTYDFDKQTVEGRRQINSTLRLDYAELEVDSGREEHGERTDQARWSRRARLPDRSADRRVLRCRRSPWRWGRAS